MVPIADDPGARIVPTTDLDVGIGELQDEGYRLDMIAPADAPRIAEMSANGERLRLVVAAPDAGGAPVGAEVVDEGRAGMRYRDLIPDRHDGRVIASHITIPNPGPVPDYVHYHDVDFQVIYARAGRVRVVYEDQGEPFWMEPGDCILQPPHIRHRVLETEGRLEVIEVTAPAEHPTYVEHDLALPNGVGDAGRLFGGQRFHFSRATDTEWCAVGEGWEVARTGILGASFDAGDVHRFRPQQDAPASAFADGFDDGSLSMFVVVDGACAVDLNGAVQEFTEGQCASRAEPTEWRLERPSSDCVVLHVTLGWHGERFASDGI